LERRTLGETGLRVTPLGLGTYPLGRLDRVPEVATAIEIVRAAFTAGINFVDTAAGDANRRVGLALRELGDLVPDDLVLHAKVGYRPARFDYGGEAMTRESLETTLGLLGRDRLDVVTLHDVQHTDLATAMGGAHVALRKLRDEGVIGAVGVSGFAPAMLREYVETGGFDVMLSHNRYTLLNVAALDLFARCRELGVGVINAAPFASGLLARPASTDVTFDYREPPAGQRERAGRLAAICQELGVDLRTAAVRFCTRQELVGLTLVGASDPEQVELAAAALRVPIPDELWDRLRTEVPPDTEHVEPATWEKDGVPPRPANPEEVEPA